MLNLNLTDAQLELLGNWKVELSTYHQQNSLIQSFTAEYNELLRLEKVVICFGAPINCFDAQLQLIKAKIHHSTQIRDLVYNLLNR